ncbi:CubicO group peptidase (beta-lactamase class C family) [Sphingomonas kaistensis]|uniref:CubicO group peptidase (Beta-lactamase class C family) n=1 Tax=Sphingomonas kaistensis TaxID=298708 RepID=A0A7X5Y4P5_9SPHN|nr:serine hydrolase [Sphingomonas kaistensis]NJC05134.1 CubicO group peptidase (beta-lactamase class C family) [Sphingomonas kaistensis]
MTEVRRQAEAIPRLHSVIVARQGETLAEYRLRGPGLDQPVNIKSASKSVLSALVGIAIGRGVLTGPEQKIAPLLRSDVPQGADPRIEQVEVGHLLSMQAGLGRTSGPNYGAWVASPNWVRYALSRPFAADPGGEMLYSTGSSHLLSAILTRASGRSTHALAQEWLAEPLGITLPQWPRDPQGIYFGGNDMLMSPRALLRLGELYRQDGVWEGKRILPEGWVAQSWKPRTTSPWSGNPYGYGWFSQQSGGREVHFAWGYGGQMLFIVPSLDLTVVMISDPSPRPREESHVSDLARILATGIIPAAEKGAGPPPVS